MMKVAARIDHYIVGASRNIKDILTDYAELGFQSCPFEQTMRHNPGLRTGFIFFSPKGAGDYIEFLTVEDRQQFTAAPPKDDRKYTERSCAQGVGIRVNDAQGIYEQLIAQGTAVGPVVSKRPEDQGTDKPFRWSFVNLKESVAKLGSFYVQYLFPRPAQAPDIIDGGNGIYALGGLLYNNTDVAKVAALLAKDFPKNLVRNSGAELWLGCHRIVAKPFQEFLAECGTDAEFFQNPGVSVYGALLYSDSLAKTAAALKGKWKPHRVLKDKILLLPTEHEGLLAIVQEKPISEWQKERLTGEWAF